MSIWFNHTVDCFGVTLYLKVLLWNLWFWECWENSYALWNVSNLTFWGLLAKAKCWILLLFLWYNILLFFQLPRLYNVYKDMGIVTSFQNMLDNIFLPLFEVTVNPDSHPQLHVFLKQVCHLSFYKIFSFFFMLVCTVNLHLYISWECWQLNGNCKLQWLLNSTIIIGLYLNCWPPLETLLDCKW